MHFFFLQPGLMSVCEMSTKFENGKICKQRRSELTQDSRKLFSHLKSMRQSERGCGLIILVGRRMEFTSCILVFCTHFTNFEGFFFKYVYYLCCCDFIVPHLVLILCQNMYCLFLNRAEWMKCMGFNKRSDIFNCIDCTVYTVYCQCHWKTILKATVVGSWVS